ncbi:MAG: DUF721 domain-containing protein [Candidatus Electrothrix sp. YB6]
MPERTKHLTPLADTLSAVYGRQQWGNQWHLYTLVRHWPELAGSAFAEHSMPAYFRRKELWVYVQSSVWMQQMHLCRTDILAKVNAFLPGRSIAEDIRWTLQPAELVPLPDRPDTAPPAEVDPATEQRFRAMAENVANPEARAALCRLWRMMETRRKK